jgi:3-deoxy-manno-octulosonate cytidylyltransferase (CMP-KDO synthetase)
MSASRTGVAIVIPARYASTRFPGKPLTLIGGKLMIQRVWEQAKQATLAERVIVATDDDRIANAVRGFGGEICMTASDHSTGTDRLAEVASNLPDIKIICNVQGDEPLISPLAIDAAIRPLLEDGNVEMSTIAYAINDEEKWRSPQLVKVVLDRNGFALYFSRYPIPFERDPGEQPHVQRLGHAGLYVYKKETLQRIAKLEPTPLEMTEKLEQLRALENGIRIKVVINNHASPGVDVPEDIAKVEALLAAPHVVPVVTGV